MTGCRLTFALIRQKNPAINDTDIDQIESLDLSSLHLSCIENLELFAHVRGMNLSCNDIEIIENLELFQNLQFLDISCNKLIPASLLTSAKALPKTLKAINLAGNPCIEDQEVLGQFQDLFQDLDIIVDMEEGNDEVEESERQQPSLEDTPTESPKAKTISTNQKLNAEEILQEIVDRKCRLQGMEAAFDLEATMKNLNSELDSAILTTANSRKALMSKIQVQDEQEENHGKQVKEQIDFLLQRSKTDTSNYKDIIKRMREKADRALANMQENT